MNRATELTSCSWYNLSLCDAMDALIGTSLGPYEILAVLGRGGMGEVYRARDTRLNRIVAIKFLAPEMADAVARRRFQQEAQTASSLNHPHILTVFEAGESDGRQYLVTEFIDGGTLKDWAHDQTRTLRQKVELLTGVADGLAAAHTAGILHRDIKPANILVAKNGYAKLGDFGLAKLAEPAAEPGAYDTTLSASEERTREGVIVGTIAYMSPEQASGQRLDARSDIFSFGVVLYEAASGHRPFAATSDALALQAVIHGAAEPLRNDVPVALRLIVEKALEKDPADRYQSMREMVVDLRRLARAKTEVASAAPATLPPAPTSRRLWARGAAGLAIGLILAVGAWLAGRTAPAPAAPDNPLANAKFSRLTDFPGPKRMPRFLRTEDLSLSCPTAMGSSTSGGARWAPGGSPT
jgi:serine/threonine protein kinase